MLFISQHAYNAFKALGRGIENLFRWLPVIWRDRDHDHFFVEVMLLEKLTHTYNFFISDEAVGDWEDEYKSSSLKALRICITILERRTSGFYLKMGAGTSLEKAMLTYDMEKRDQELLGKLFGTYISYWWD